MLVSRPRLDVLHASAGIDHDGGRPASHAISPGDPLPRESCTSGNDRPSRLRISSSALPSLPPWNATMNGGLLAGLVQFLKTGELGEARRRPRLPEIQYRPSSAQAMKRRTDLARSSVECRVGRGFAGLNGQPQRTEAAASASARVAFRARPPAPRRPVRLRASTRTCDWR